MKSFPQGNASARLQGLGDMCINKRLIIFMFLWFYLFLLSFVSTI